MVEGCPEQLFSFLNVASRTPNRIEKIYQGVCGDFEGEGTIFRVGDSSHCVPKAHGILLTDKNTGDFRPRY